MKNQRGLGAKSTFLVANLLIFIKLAVFASTVSFLPMQTYPVGSNPTAVAVADFNGDGKPDLAVVNMGDPSVGDAGGVSILFGNGDGTFQAAKNISVGTNCEFIAAGDLDGDGKADLALVRPSDLNSNDNGDVTIFLGNGDGTFRQGAVLTPGETPWNIVATDLNGDQKLDLIVVTTGDNSVSVLLGNGDGSFQLPVAYVTTSQASQVAVGDFDQDGKKDLVIFHSFFIPSNILLGNGDGTFRQAPVLTAPPFIAVGDFNGDSKLDIAGEACRIVGLKSECGYGLWLGNGDATFQSAIPIAQAVSAAADFDGDGRLDIAGPGAAGSGLIAIAAGNGDGTFRPPVTFSGGGDIILAADINGDKAPDLVMMLAGSNSISVLVNTGTDFSMTASTPSLSTLSSGQSATSTVTLKRLTNFDNPVSLACTVQPAQGGAPTCSLNSSSVIFDAGGNATATLTITAGTASASLRGPASRGRTRPFRIGWLQVTGFAFVGAGFGIGSSRKRRVLLFVMGLLLLSGLTAQVACGGSGGSKSTAYTVTVIATSGATQHSTLVTLAVQ